MLLFSFHDGLILFVRVSVVTFLVGLFLFSSVLLMVAAGS